MKRQEESNYIYIQKKHSKETKETKRNKNKRNKRNKNLRDIIRGNKLFDNKKILNVKKFNKGKCQPCFTRSINLCCKKLKTCSTFQSAFNKNTF